MQAFAPAALRPECSVYHTRCMLGVAWMQPVYSLDISWIYTGCRLDPMLPPFPILGPVLDLFGSFGLFWMHLDTFGLRPVWTPLGTLSLTFARFDRPIWIHLDLLVLKYCVTVALDYPLATF